MKKVTIQISFDAEKLKAIQKYMQKKDISLQSELDDALQKLYEKHVPPAVREYIESDAQEAQAATPRPPRPRPATPAHAGGDGSAQ